MDSAITTSTLPAGLSRVEPAPGIRAVDIDIPSCRGRIVDQGAHLTSWVPTGQEPVIFTSSRARFAPGKAIRGGVPICLPWFGPGPSGDRKPAHGYARTSVWMLIGAHTDGTGAASTATVRFQLDSRDVESAQEDFIAVFTAVLGATLRLELTVTARADLTLQDALHSYLAVADVRGVEIVGLAGSRYLDKLTGTQGTTPDTFTLTGPTDQVHASEATVDIVERAGRTIRVEKSGSRDTVVWNPWDEGALGLDDLDDAEWTGFVCVEAADVDPPVVLAAGRTHTLGVRVSTLR